MAAALKLIAANGFQATTTDMIARQAGVASGTLFNYFRSKDELVVELYRQVKRNLVQQIFAATDRSLPKREMLRQVWFLSVEAVVSSREEMLFLDQFYGSPYSRLVPSEMRQSLLAPLSEVVNSAMDSGVLKRMPAPLFEMFFFDPILGVARRYFLGEIQIDQAALDFVFNCCWDSVKGAG